MGRVVGGLRITLIIRLSQPSLAGVGAGAELGNFHLLSKVDFQMNNS